MNIARKLIVRAAELGDKRRWRFYFQRRFMSPALRDRIARKIALRRNGNSDPNVDQIEDGHSRGEMLSESGFEHLGEVLDAAQCKEIVDYFKNCKVFDSYRPKTPPFLPLSGEGDPLSHVAFHEPEDVIRAPYLLEIANRPEILAAVERFLRCKPTISYMAAWWSYPTPLGAQQAENFHRDVDDWKFVKLFVYLTDVGKDKGPHVYVLNTADDERLAAIKRFSDEEVQATFGNNAIQVNEGRAGEAFLENTFGLHKGQPVEEGHRLLFQVMYSLSPTPYGPKKPVDSASSDLAGMPIDPWINRIYIANN